VPPDSKHGGSATHLDQLDVGARNVGVNTFVQRRSRMSAFDMIDNVISLFNAARDIGAECRPRRKELALGGTGG
jgi:hypothetical protein